MVVLGLLWHFSGFGQLNDPKLQRVKTIKLDSASVKIDTFSIQPFDFRIVDQDSLIIPQTAYKVDFVKAQLYFKDFKQYRNQYITIFYKVFPEQYRRIYQVYDLDAVHQDSLQSLRLLPKAKPVSPKPFEGLNTQGSITRGFMTGNQQSLVMQSGLDLKIEGRISSKLKVKAVLSDDNLPQAYAGISQSYKEFNRIYLQLEAPNWQATGGDLLLKEQAGYFLKFSRKSQGLSVQIGQDSAQVQITGGVIDGQFGINRFNGIDGNQGPYVLKGNRGEIYIFIIPGSEKVYVNGRLLKAGEDKDYILNYETAELRFNPSFPINRNQRITVEFNYSNQHYLRYLNYDRYQYKGQKSQWSIYGFIESDAKNQTLLYDLTPQQVAALKNAGDNPQELWITSAVSASYNENKILYKKIQNGNTSYFEYTNTDEPDLYEVKFSYFGKNKGSYRIKEVTAIGKIYEYAGINQGDYEPKIRLTPPVSRKYMGINYRYRPGQQTDFMFAGLINHNDKNLFSTVDDQDNLGGALHLSLKQRLWQRQNQSVFVNAKYDYVHPYFEALDPYRPVEFTREWQIDSLYGRQHLADMSLDYYTQKNYLKGGMRYFNLRDTLQARQYYINHRWQYQKWQSDGRYQYTSQQAGFDLNAALIEQQLLYKFKTFTLTGIGHFESRDKKTKQLPDSLNYRYAYGELQWQKIDSSRWQIGLSYRHERNDSIYNRQWFMAQETDQFGLKWSSKGSNHHIKLFMQYRHTRDLQPKTAKDYLNMKWWWQQNYFKKFVTTQVSIESFNGNTLRDEVIFVETPPGQGVYVWNDYNGNGIKEINEFEVAVFRDQANYIRVVLPSKNYVPTLNNAYQLQVNINPSVWQKKRFLSKLYAVWLVQIKHQSLKDGQIFPLVWQPADILQQNTLWQYDLFFNRAQKRYHLHFTYQYSDRQQLLLVGTQRQRVEQYRLRTKHAFKSSFVWQQNFIIGQNAHFSENYQQKNYRLQIKAVEEGLQMGDGVKNKFYTYYEFKDKTNWSGTEKLKMHKLGLRYTHFNLKQNRFHADLQWVKNDLSGNSQTAVAYQMLEALQPGNNVVLNILYRQKVSAYLDLNLSYGMRLSQSHPAVHTGGIQLKMIF